MEKICITPRYDTLLIHLYARMSKTMVKIMRLKCIKDKI